jgi:hypothetical protein
MSAYMGRNDTPVSPTQPPPYDTIQELEARRQSLLRQQSTGVTTQLRLSIWTVYRQLFSIVCLANIAGVLFVTIRGISSSQPPLTDFMAHPEILLTLPGIDDPVERFVAVTKFYLSGWHIKPP